MVEEQEKNNEERSIWLWMFVYCLIITGLVTMTFLFIEVTKFLARNLA